MTITQEGSKKQELVITDRRVDFKEAKKIAQYDNGRLPALSEFIFAIKDLIKFSQLKGDAYWICDAGPRISEFARIDYENGTLVEVSKKDWKNLPNEQKAYVYKFYPVQRDGAFAIYVYTDDSGVKRLDVFSGNPTYCCVLAYMHTPKGHNSRDNSIPLDNTLAAKEVTLKGYWDNVGKVDTTKMLRIGE